MQKVAVFPRKRRDDWKPLQVGLVALVLSIAIAYAIGTKEAADFAFNCWLVASGVYSTVNMLRFRDMKTQGAFSALATWTIWLVLTIALGTMVFGEKCPFTSVPRFELPRLEGTRAYKGVNAASGLTAGR
ncbi:MAG: hypothetical protein NT023_24025 [Armatimonadetes bacterium]|nr:hypothetical protein [Armatimonadota bacterium]